jgi:hypothetical protein
MNEKLYDALDRYPKNFYYYKENAEPVKNTTVRNVYLRLQTALNGLENLTRGNDGITFELLDIFPEYDALHNKITDAMDALKVEADYEKNAEIINSGLKILTNK